MSQHVSYAEFLNLLKGLVRGSASANIMMVTDDKHSLRIGVHNGVIESIALGPRKGMAALPLIRAISGGTLTLNKDAELLPPNDDLPDTETLLAQLELRTASIAPAPKAPAPKPQASSLQGDISQAEAERIAAQLQDLLKRYLGPIAGMLLPGAIERAGGLTTAANLENLLNELVTEVEGIGDHQKFLTEARKITHP